MGEAVKAVEEAFKQVGSGGAVSPPRPFIDITNHQGNLLLNCGYLSQSDALAVKVATSYPNNTKLGLPTVGSLFALFDPKTGGLLALMEGTYLTAIKTGAEGAVAAKYLAPRNAKRVGIIGSGVQGETQLWGLVEVLKIEEASVYGRDWKRRELFKDRVEKRFGIPVRAARSSEEVVRESDIVVAATTSLTPVFEGKWLKEGAHVTGVGSFTHNARELDGVTIERAGRVFIDNQEAVEVGDLRIAFEEGRLRRESVVHLSELVVGRVVGRRREVEITVFKSVGGAPYDVSIAQRAYNLAGGRGVGTEVRF